jgi:hypothetical protein
MERKNLESAAANYWYLRGLLSIPVGILFIFAGLTNLGWGPRSPVWVFGAAVLVAGLTYLGISRHYNDTYGRVTPARRDQARATVATVIGAVVIVGGVEMDWLLDLPVSATAAAFALIMLAYYGLIVGLRPHHTIIWGALLVAGLLPVWGGVGRDSKINVGLLLMGVATIAAGIFDHGALKRSLRPANGLNLENGNVGA